MTMTITDWSGVAAYTVASVVALWLAADLYGAWRITRTEMTRNLFIMSLCWVAWSVLAAITICVIGDLFWRDVTRTLLRVAALGAIVSARWAIKAR